jgi:hypothetical protein
MKDRTPRAYNPSVLEHDALPESMHYLAEWPEQVRTWLWSHRNCEAGPGNCRSSCLRRWQLLEICRDKGWDFPIPPPDSERKAVEWQAPSPLYK